MCGGSLDGNVREGWSEKSWVQISTIASFLTQETPLVLASLQVLFFLPNLTFRE
jgi:hypothetical protein